MKNENTLPDWAKEALKKLKTKGWRYYDGDDQRRPKLAPCLSRQGVHLIFWTHYQATTALGGVTFTSDPCADPNKAVKNLFAQVKRARKEMIADLHNTDLLLERLAHFNEEKEMYRSE